MIYVFYLVLNVGQCLSFNIFQYSYGDLEKNYGKLSEKEKLKLKNDSKEIFYFAFENYRNYAFPLDELDPIHCKGRGPDYENPSNININDVLGDYSLSLIDALSTLAVIGDIQKFKEAVESVIEHVSFNKNSTLQVFEANIRVLGALLSAHLLIIDDEQPFGSLEPDWYDGELLDLAADLAARLLPAFEHSKTGLPHPRVNLRGGVPPNGRSDTCTAGAGSLLIEFGILSRLLGDPVYEMTARRANSVLWKLRNNATGLFGNVIDIQSGRWMGGLSGLGAGLDSFFEYMLKAYVLFGNANDFKMFNESYKQIKKYLRRGREFCNEGQGEHPMYVNVDMNDGSTYNTWVDSLQASFAAIQVLAGDIEEAICHHAFYYMLWKKYGVLPERYDWKLKYPAVKFYPLRPEFVESTYFLYQATKNPFYLHVGKDIVNSLNGLARARCGFATIHSVLDMTQEDRMESFFLSETTKYLYLLFDEENPVNRRPGRYLFTTEGHVIPFGSWQRAGESFENFARSPTLPNVTLSGANCEIFDKERTFGLPLREEYLRQVSASLGVDL